MKGLIKKFILLFFVVSRIQGMEDNNHTIINVTDQTIWVKINYDDEVSQHWLMLPNQPLQYRRPRKTLKLSVRRLEKANEEADETEERVFKFSKANNVDIDDIRDYYIRFCSGQFLLCCDAKQIHQMPAGVIYNYSSLFVKNDSKKLLYFDICIKTKQDVNEQTMGHKYQALSCQGQILDLCNANGTQIENVNHVLFTVRALKLDPEKQLVADDKKLTLRLSKGKRILLAYHPNRAEYFRIIPDLRCFLTAITDC